jgi:hypothetical protein
MSVRTLRRFARAVKNRAPPHGRLTADSLSGRHNARTRYGSLPVRQNRRGASPRGVIERLESYLPPSERIGVGDRLSDGSAGAEAAA